MKVDKFIKDNYFKNDTEVQIVPITDNIQEYEADLVEVYLKDFYTT